MSALFQRLLAKTRSEDTTNSDSDFHSESEYSEGDLKYVANKGGNGGASYQEASGAPVRLRGLEDCRCTYQCAYTKQPLVGGSQLPSRIYRRRRYYRLSELE